MAGEVVHVEFPSGDADRAQAFWGGLFGWVGDSGNAESTRPHLHFEIHQPDGTVINPFYSLCSIVPRVEQIRSSLAQIDHLMSLETEHSPKGVHTRLSRLRELRLLRRDEVRR